MILYKSYTIWYQGIIAGSEHVLVLWVGFYPIVKNRLPMGVNVLGGNEQKFSSKRGPFTNFQFYISVFPSMGALT